jgi:hypothetical protein
LKTRTRITEAGLRRLIRHFLNEGPLAEIPPANPGEPGRPAYISLNAADFPKEIFTDQQIDTTKSSVGYGLNAEDVKLFLKDTKHKWAIFTLPFTASKPSPVGPGISGPPGAPLKDGDFKKTLLNVVKKRAEELNIPAGTKILVVGDGPFADDYKNVHWAIGHDIFGHTISSLDRREDQTSLELGTLLGDNIRDVYNALQKSLGIPGKVFNPEELHNSYVTGAERDAAEAQLKAASKNMKLTTNILNRLIHESLPRGKKVAGSETNDIKPDIYAAIFLYPGIKLDKQTVHDHLDLPKIADLIQREGVPSKKIEYFKNIISDAADALFEAYRAHIDRWLESIEPNTPTLIYLW